MNQMIEKVLKQVESEINSGTTQNTSTCCQGIGVSEYIGTAVGSTIGLVIPSVDPQLTKTMKLGKYRSIGFFGGRSAFGPQVMAIDEAVKATSTEVIKLESPRDDRDGAGPGSYIVIGGDDVSDVRRAIEIALDRLETYFGDIYTNSAGHLEFQYTARASSCIEKAFGVKEGQAFGLVCGGPAPIGAVLTDIAVKAANVEICSYTSPADGEGFCYANEITTTFTGDSGAVRQAVKAAIEPGKKILGAMGDEPKCVAVPYI